MYGRSSAPTQHHHVAFACDVPGTDDALPHRVPRYASLAIAEAQL